ESAALIHDALERLQHGKTTLVIAHNFAAMERFDLILVLKNNRVLEQGTHERLLEQKGRYYRLYQRQIRSEYSPSIYTERAESTKILVRFENIFLRVLKSGQNRRHALTLLLTITTLRRAIFWPRELILNP